VVSVDRSTLDDDQPALIVRYGQLLDDELPEAQRADRPADMLVELGAEAGVRGRCAAPVLGGHPAVAMHVDGVAYSPARLDRNPVTHLPDHLVVAGPHAVITASPDGLGAHATVYRTDLITCTSELIAEVASNRVHGLASSGPDCPLLLLGDVRGTDIRLPHPRDRDGR
jgi:hypothetical protein